MVKKPVRVQRKRSKGWRMPENTVYVGRPTIWGNPYKVVDGNYELAVSMFEAMMYLRSNDGLSRASKRFRDFVVKKLKGKNLACWCSLDKPCHADILLKIANNNDS